jgi:hypothetical protein
MPSRNKKSRSGVSKSFAQKRTLNASRAGKVAKGQPDVSDQDPKRRIGNFGGTGEPHMSKKGTRGKNH